MRAPFPDAAAGPYDRGRAPYPPSVVAALGLPPGARVLDLAAGTGLLSSALLQAGHDVLALEPVAAMRTQLEKKVGAARVLDGVAEVIALPDSSVDAVTAGDAFHWFDPVLAAAEIARVLRSRGHVGLIWRRPDFRGGRSGWNDVVAAALTAHRGRHPSFVGEQGREGFVEHGGFTAFTHQAVRFTHHTDHDGVLAHVASISYVARLDAAARAALFAELEAVVPPGEIAERYRADVWLTRLKR